MEALIKQSQRIDENKDQKMQQNPHHQTKAPMLCCCSCSRLEPDAFLVGLMIKSPRIIDHYISPHHDLLPLRLPKYDIEPHLRRQIHPENRRTVRPNRPGNRSPICLHVTILLRLLLMPLMKLGYRIVPYNMAPVWEVKESQINRIIENTLVFVGVVKPNHEVKRVVSSRVEGFVKSRKIEVLYGARRI